MTSTRLQTLPLDATVVGMWMCTSARGDMWCR
jgi:hypothetical protein